MNTHSNILSGAYWGQWSGESSSTKDSKNLLVSISPIDNTRLVQVCTASESDYQQVLKASVTTFEKWRKTPAPVRGQLIYEIAKELRTNKARLAELISTEVGKIRSEGEGEVQEAIDIADFAVGLSRQLCGQTMHSERPEHRMYEQWHPLGPVGVITAFNFPLAVWAWNAFLAAVCGNSVIWKPSQLAPAVAIETVKLLEPICRAHGVEGLFSLLIDSDGSLGRKVAEDPRIPLVSATGSTEIGRKVGQTVAARFGKSLLELGGNNAVIIMEDANLELAVRSTVFGAVGTAGQRCTSTRRLLVQSSIFEEVLTKLKQAYSQIKIGNPLEPGVLCGPLINQAAVEKFLKAIAEVQRQGGVLEFGGKALEQLPSAHYVEPTLVRATRAMPIVQQETFAPILYCMPISDLTEAIEINNEVPQGLSSAIFTQSIKYSERFLSSLGSDCGIANVNIGTSGAEVGGAFGGEKETGGGRESGSESWKAYMRRQTNTVNWGEKLPLAQGVVFE